MKAAFFLDIDGKMQSLSLLRLIEKFAEIHRQVSLRSLTTAGLGVLRCSFRFESVSIAECSAFCSETTLFSTGNDYWGFDPGNSHRGTVLCLRQTRPLRERASTPCDFQFPPC